MKKKLLYLIVFLITSSVYGQNANWNLTTGLSTFPFNYSFKSTSGTYVYNTASGSSTTFLPAAPSGSTRVGVGSTGTPSFTLMENGTKDSLKFNTSSVGTAGKFSLYNAAGASGLTSYFLTLNFDNLTATRADWNLAVGSSTAATSLFNSATGLSTTGATSSPEIFGFLRFLVVDANTMSISYRTKPNTTDNIAITTVATTLNRGTNYAFEILCNNTADAQAYTKGANIYTVPSRTYQIWINGVRLEKATGDYDFPANQLAVNSSLNSIVLTGNNGQIGTPAPATPSNDGSVIISKLSMQFVNSTLPVSLIQFTGKNELGKVNLSWQTASESNNSHFEILKSTDENLVPTKIGEVNGKGNSNAIVNYSFVDNSPSKGNNYYQLKQVDFDGKSTLSNILVVKNGNFTEQNFNIYQAENQTIEVNINSSVVDKANLKLIGLDGQVITNLNTQLQKGDNSIQLYNQPLAKGIYLIKLDVKGAQSVKKFVSK